MELRAIVYKNNKQLQSKELQEFVPRFQEFWETYTQKYILEIAVTNNHLVITALQTIGDNEQQVYLSIPNSRLFFSGEYRVEFMKTD